jgi:sortase A
MVLGAVLVSEMDFQLQRLVTAWGRTPEWPFQTDFGLRVPANEGRLGLTIPRIYVKTTVVPQVNAASREAYEPALQQGVVQAQGSDEPGTGGLGFYFAHSSSLNTWRNPGAAVFYRLEKLEAGDLIYLTYDGQEFTYQVTEKEVIAADDVSFLAREDDGSELVVLQTCWPIGTNLKRLNVYAARVS